MFQLLQQIVNEDPRHPFSKGEIHSVQRPDLELAWTEIIFMDSTEGREARSRLCLARGSHIQSFISMDFWPEDAGRVGPVWDEALRSLQLGVHVKDPTRGHVLH